MKAVEERNETGYPLQVPEFRGCAKGRRQVRDLKPDPRFHFEFAPGYDPAEPL